MYKKLLLLFLVLFTFITNIKARDYPIEINEEPSYDEINDDHLFESAGPNFPSNTYYLKENYDKTWLKRPLNLKKGIIYDDEYILSDDNYQSDEHIYKHIDNNSLVFELINQKELNLKLLKPVGRIGDREIARRYRFTNLIAHVGYHPTISFKDFKESVVYFNHILSVDIELDYYYLDDGSDAPFVGNFLSKGFTHQRLDLEGLLPLNARMHIIEKDPYLRYDNKHNAKPLVGDGVMFYTNAINMNAAVLWYPEGRSAKLRVLNPYFVPGNASALVVFSFGTTLKTNYVPAKPIGRFNFHNYLNPVLDKTNNYLQVSQKVPQKDIDISFDLNKISFEIIKDKNLEYLNSDKVFCDNIELDKHKIEISGNEKRIVHIDYRDLNCDYLHIVSEVKVDRDLEDDKVKDPDVIVHFNDMPKISKTESNYTDIIRKHRLIINFVEKGEIVEHNFDQMVEDGYVPTMPDLPKITDITYRLVKEPKFKPIHKDEIINIELEKLLDYEIRFIHKKEVIETINNKEKVVAGFIPKIPDLPTSSEGRFLLKNKDFTMPEINEDKQIIEIELLKSTPMLALTKAKEELITIIYRYKDIELSKESDKKKIGEKVKVNIPYTSEGEFFLLNDIPTITADTDIYYIDLGLKEANKTLLPDTGNDFNLILPIMGVALILVSIVIIIKKPKVK